MSIKTSNDLVSLGGAATLGVGLSLGLVLGLLLAKRNRGNAENMNSSLVKRVLGLEQESDKLLPFEFLANTMPKQVAWDLRKAFFCSSQSVSYSNSDPLMIMKGQGQYLIDEKGVQYLDTRNNVGHVGWQDETVVKAVQRQIARTNSNTRYLHPNAGLLAQNLLSTFPKELCVCFFVNSGSEANDLAFRLARAYTKAEDVIVVDRGYHGSTSTCVQLSPYKFAGKGGAGKEPWVQVVPCPDTYRGLYSGEGAGKRYAQLVGDACARIKERGSNVCAFFVESGMSVAGVIMPPEGYLEHAYQYVRSHGGVCIADEVQVGFGRLGNFYWGFQQQGVVPDIVTMGKPIGNGFPLAAVVCTRAIAAAFDNGMEFFNTFGGNPVACAAGLAVFHVMMRDDLQAHAKKVGRYLREKLANLVGSPAGELIGDIRGHGLFQGIEFVRDRATKEAATEETSAISTRLLREYQILTSIDGKHKNVLIIKPPLRFSEENADYFVGALEKVLSTLHREDIENTGMTPT